MEAEVYRTQQGTTRYMSQLGMASGFGRVQVKKMEKMPVGLFLIFTTFAHF